MKGNSKITKKFGCMCLALILVLTCMMPKSFAADSEGESSNDTGLPNAELPFIKMMVRPTKLEDLSTQVKVDCYIQNVTDLSGIDFVITYNNQKLIPSYVNNNQEISGDLELMNSFSLDENYKDKLFVNIFRSLEQDETSGALQFVFSKISNETADEYDQPINMPAEEGVYIGSFSFKQKEGQIEENEFDVERVKVTSGKGDTEKFYIRTKTETETCDEMMQFMYEKYGSISGEINASITTVGGKLYSSKNITKIKLYKSSDLSTIDFTNKNYRDSLPEVYIEYITTAEENGKFKIDNIEYGNYVIIFDKDNYADWIITNVNVSSDNKEIDFTKIIKIGMETQGIIKEDGIVNLIPGDINKDGIINTNDTLLYNADVKKDKLIDFNDATSRKGEANESNDVLMYNAAYTQYKSVGKKTVNVKTIINL